MNITSSQPQFSGKKAEQLFRKVACRIPLVKASNDFPTTHDQIVLTPDTPIHRQIPTEDVIATNKALIKEIKDYRETTKNPVVKKISPAF